MENESETENEIEIEVVDSNPLTLSSGMKWE